MQRLMQRVLHVLLVNDLPLLPALLHTAHSPRANQPMLLVVGVRILQCRMAPCPVRVQR